MNFGIAKIKGEADVDYKDKLKEDNCSLDVTIFSDAVDCTPLTFESALEEATKLPQMLKQKNDGKGVAISFTLTPVAAIASIFSETDLKIENLYHKVSEAIIWGLIEENDELDDLSGQVNNIYKRLKANKHYYDDFMVNEFNENRKMFEKCHRDYLDWVGEVITYARANRDDRKIKMVLKGRKTIDELDNPRPDIDEARDDIEEVISKMETALQFETDMTELQKHDETKHIQFVGVDTSIHRLMENRDKSYTVLKLPSDCCLQNDERARYNFFLSMAKDAFFDKRLSTESFIIQKLSFSKTKFLKLVGLNSIRIDEYLNGEKMNSKCLYKYQQSLGKCYKSK